MRRFAPSLFREMIGSPSTARCTVSGPRSFVPELLHKNKTPARLERAGAEKQQRYYWPTIVAPRKFKTSSIGLAIALVLLPANKRPTACGLVAASSTINEPESPLFKNELRELLMTICPVKVFVNAVPPAHSLS